MTVASCKDLIDSRFPADGDNGAAAMLLAYGTILTGTAPDAVNASVEVCHEIEPYCGAYRLNQRRAYGGSDDVRTGRWAGRVGQPIRAGVRRSMR